MGSSYEKNKWNIFLNISDEDFKVEVKYVFEILIGIFVADFFPLPTYLTWQFASIQLIIMVYYINDE